MSGTKEVKPGMFAEDLTKQERREWFTLTESDVEHITGVDETDSHSATAD